MTNPSQTCCVNRHCFTEGIGFEDCCPECEAPWENTPTQPVAQPYEAFLERMKDEMTDNLTLSSKVPYHQTDHFHCWTEKKPPCGQKIEHLKCCLCELPNPKVEKLRSQSRTEERAEIVKMVEKMKEEIMQKEGSDTLSPTGNVVYYYLSKLLQSLGE